MTLRTLKLVIVQDYMFNLHEILVFYNKNLIKNPEVIQIQFRVRNTSHITATFSGHRCGRVE